MNRENMRHIIKKETALKASGKTLKDIYEIMFSVKENILCEDSDGIRIHRYTYADIQAKIQLAAEGLYAKIGATHSFIALEMENSTNWIIAFWAIIKSGNKPYLVNMRYPDTLSEDILKTLEIRYIICNGESRLTGECIPVQSFFGGGKPVPEDVFEDEIAFSSSATSMNQVICFYSGLQISNMLLNYRSILKKDPSMAKHYKGMLKQLAFLPFYHIFGLFAVYFWFSFFGRTIVFLRDYSADTILKTCRKHEVTHIFAVPMLWHTIEKQVLSTAEKEGPAQLNKLQRGIKAMTALQNLSPSLGSAIAKQVMSPVTDKLFGKSVMYCISGGSYLRDSALALLNGMGYNLHNGYGMSEVGITSVELRRKPKALNQNAIGQPFDSVEYKIDDNGLLWIKGNSLCTKKIVNGVPFEMSEWFCTDDIVAEKDGIYYILGRTSDTVIGENGENINPDIIEKQFSLTQAKAISVLGLQEGTQEQLTLIAQLSPYASPESIRKIRDGFYAINDQLPSAMAVKRFYFTFDMISPPTAIKVSRKQLRKKIDAGDVKLIAFQDIDCTPAQNTDANPLTKEVTNIVAKTLGIAAEDIQPSSHIFYDLGATSIQYFSVLSAISEHFGLNDFGKNDTYCYTVSQISEYIERHL